jgi:long-chain acyl-CoA synthetase
MPIEEKSILQHIYDNEKSKANQVYTSQPYTSDDVRDTTWGEFMQEARKMASYLQSLGFEKGDRIGMISKNCDKFICAEVAIWMAGYTTVAIFPNTNESTVNYCLTDAEVKALFVGKLDDYETLEPGFPADIPKIAFPLAPAAARDSFDHWEDIIAKSEPLEGEPDRAREDFALFIYTSGSTGKPKGVVHDFGHIQDAVHGILNSLSKFITKDTRILSYLPLAHVFERCYVGMTSLTMGFHVFFAETIKTFKDDLVRAQPTVFISVPRLWVKFQQGVFQKFSPGKLKVLFSIPGVSSIIKGAIRKALGLNQVKLAGSGSAPLPAELLSWYQKIGLNLYEGYAMSEDFAYSHLSQKGSSKPGYVGKPYPGVDVRIDPETQEILIKSLGRMVEYWKLPEKTAESFTEDGYFKTGDRGLREADGMLKITGRLKELFKTSKGKYVSPAPIENLLNEDPLVELSLVGGASMPQPYCQIVIAEDVRIKLQKNPDDAGLKKMITDKISSLLDKVNGQIEHHEQMKFAVIATSEWTTENQKLTPTLKIKRGTIEDEAQPKLDGWYEAGEKIIFD